MLETLYERSSWAAGRGLLAFDEAGYGSVAGSMFVAGVIFPINYDFAILCGLNDSKRLSEKKRFELELMIKREAEWYGIVSRTADEIDSGNVYYMRFAAAEALGVHIGNVDVIMDGNVSLNMPNAHSSMCLVKGDSKCPSIAASSILAKCAKDREMIELHNECPEYGWNRNKGYLNAAHSAAIVKSGLTRHHRRSYCKKFIG